MVVVRETYPKRIGDWVNVAHIALAGIPTLPRLMNTYQAIRDIKKKYPDHKIDIAGWSAGGLEAQLFSFMGNETYGYNPGTTYSNSKDKNMYPNYNVMRNKTDIVSNFLVNGAGSV